MAYQFTEYGSQYPAPGTYYDNTGFYDDRKASKAGSRDGTFVPVRTYPSQAELQYQKGPKGPQRFNNHALRTSFVAVFCCLPFGLIGLIYAMLGYTDHKHSDMHSYRKKIRCSLGWSITAIVFGSLVFIAYISVLVWMASVGFALVR